MELEKKSRWYVGVEGSADNIEYLSIVSSNNPSRQNNDMVVDANDAGEAQVRTIRQSNSVLRRLRAFEIWLDRKMKFEAMGIERVPEDKRRPPEILNMMFFWFSLLISPTLIPIGMLGPLFGLSVNTSVILTILATMVGTSVPAFASTLCPPSGLRQLAVARYAFGIYGSRFCGLLNIIVNCGYGVISCLVGGQLLQAVSGGVIPLAVGIIIIVVIAFIISFFGYVVIHHYERYAWTFAFVLICVVWGQSARYFTPTPGLSTLTGIDYTGACLSYFGVIFGVCCSWSPIVGDYYIHYPTDINKWLVFSLTYVGQAVATIFVTALGNCFGGIIMSDPAMKDIYDNGGVGALILNTLHPSGWAKFACTLFALSFLGNLIVNIYSSSLSIQLWGKHFNAVPRFVWCTILSGVILALAWGGRDKLETILNNFLPMLGYWTLSFGVILFIEHFYFRPKLGGYDLSAWQDHKRMPLGLAGVGALLIGIGFSFLGMNQTWYMAPIAEKIGVYGGDVGDELTFASTLVTYPILRTLEIRFISR